MRRFTIAVTVGAMILGTAFSGVTAASAAPIAAAPLGKAVSVGTDDGLFQEVRHRNRHHRRHGGAAIALGAAGLFLGLSALASRPRYYYDEPYSYGGPVYYRAAPWSPAWFDYCTARYRSFNPRTGYFKGYDGRYHFCR